MAMPTIIFFFLRIPVFVVVGLLRLLQHEDRHQRRRRDQVRIMFICYTFAAPQTLSIVSIQYTICIHHIKLLMFCL